MKKIITSLVLIVACSATAQYNTAIGLRGGETSGLTIKHFTGNSLAIEGIVGLWSHGFTATLLVEKHQELGSGFNLYYGGGGHLVTGTDRYYGWYRRGHRYYYYDGNTFALGIDGVIGLEYKIPQAPIAFSLDLKPYVEFVNGSGAVWTSLDPGLGIKVAF